MKPAKEATQNSLKSTPATGKKPAGFTDEERAAMRERVEELKADAAGGAVRARRRGKAPC